MSTNRSTKHNKQRKQSVGTRSKVGQKHSHGGGRSRGPGARVQSSRKPSTVVIRDSDMS